MKPEPHILTCIYGMNSRPLRSLCRCSAMMTCIHACIPTQNTHVYNYLVIHPMDLHMPTPHVHRAKRARVRRPTPNKEAVRVCEEQSARHLRSHLGRAQVRPYTAQALTMVGGEIGRRRRRQRKRERERESSILAAEAIFEAK